MSGSPSSSMRADVLSAYAVTAARVASWVIVSAVVYRSLGAAALALLTLVRTTIGVLSYTSLGLGPALVRKLAEVSGGGATTETSQALPVTIEPAAASTPWILSYASAPPAVAPALRVLDVYRTGKRLALLAGLVAMIAAAAYMRIFFRFGATTIAADTARALIACFALGIVCRLLSEPASGLLQARSRIALDNAFVAAAEIVWAVLAVAAIRSTGSSRVEHLAEVGQAFTTSSLGLLCARWIAAQLEARKVAAPAPAAIGRVDWSIARELLALGALIVIAQAADFLYAPTDCILINHLIGERAVAYYSPAIQIDAGLLLLVSGLAAVLYPRSSLAHASGDLAKVRRYYVRGTLASIALLFPAALIVALASRMIFQLWFHDPMPQTRAILPLILIHTVIGGSSAVGRSILLGMGQARPFTAAVLIAGVCNVLLSYILVRHMGLGLPGIVLGTIVVVVARCAIWMPWYVLRTLRAQQEIPANERR